MIDRVLALLSGREAPALDKGADEFELAVAALLIEAARMDESFAEAERATIERLLAARFGLQPDAVRALVEEADRLVRDSAQLFPFTRQVCKRMRPEERVGILEMMWEVAYADGVLDPHEDMLLRRVAGLIHVTDKERAAARRRAVERLAAARP
jgi:uncharacterized tellurite resistance protein B-like protein